MTITEPATPYLMAPSASTSKGAKVNSEIASNYVKEYVQIEPSDRYNFLQNVFTRNSEALIDFLALLRASFRSDVSKGLNHPPTNSPISSRVKAEHHRFLVPSTPI